jgi:hypothetical protein
MSSATQGAVRGDTSFTGKQYFEGWFAANSFATWRVGFANATAALGTLIGGDINSVGVDPVGGSIRFNASNIGTTGPGYGSSVGCAVCIAIDTVAKLFWARINGGSWNASTTADPATGTGGLSLAALGAGPYFPIFSAATNTAACIGRFGAADMAFATPAGFSVFDANVQAFIASPKFLSYALLNTPQSAMSAFKLASYALLNTPQKSANVFKLVSYVILQPPPTNGRFDYNWPLPNRGWPKPFLEKLGSQGTNPNLFPPISASAPFVGRITDPPIRWKRAQNDNAIPHSIMAKQTPNFAYLLLASL